MLEIKTYSILSEIPLNDALTFEAILKEAMQSYQSKIEEFADRYNKQPETSEELYNYIVSEFLFEKAVAILCYDEGVVVGGLFLDIKRYHSVIYDFAVSPSVQGRGIGKQILDYALKTAIDKGSNSLKLEVRDNSNAYFLYSKYGFKAVKYISNGMAKDDAKDRFTKRGIAVSSKHSVKMQIDLKDLDTMLYYRALRSYKKGQFDMTWQEYLGSFYAVTDEMYPGASFYHASAVELSKCDSIAMVGQSLVPLVISKHGFNIVSMPMCFDKEIITKLLKYEVHAEYPKEIVDNIYNSLGIGFAKAYTYYWDELKDYFTPEGGSSKGTRWEKNQILKKYPSEIVPVFDLSIYQLNDIKQLNIEWLELIKKNDKGAKESLQKTVQFLTKNRLDPIMYNSFVILYRDLIGRLVAYSYVEVHGNKAIIVENKSVIKEYSAFRYMTWLACKEANDRGAKESNIGGAQEEINPGTMKEKIVTSVGTNMDSVKASLPHRVHYTLLSFPHSKPMQEETKSHTLF